MLKTLLIAIAMLAGCLLLSVGYLTMVDPNGGIYDRNIDVGIGILLFLLWLSWWVYKKIKKKKDEKLTHLMNRGYEEDRVQTGLLRRR